VSTQVAYADIRKTKINLHKTMKLGKGRFGAVYRCTLPAAPSRMGQQSVEVVVKKLVIFYLYLMIHACVQRFDVTGTAQTFFWLFLPTKQTLCVGS
jgi:hypothetical protein